MDSNDKTKRSEPPDIPDNLTPEEFRSIIYRIINDPLQQEGSSVASILQRLYELESHFDRIPLTTHAPDKDISPNDPYIPLAHR